VTNQTELYNHSDTYDTSFFDLAVYASITSPFHMPNRKENN
jgi:hypothetical protein